MASMPRTTVLQVTKRLPALVLAMTVAALLVGCGLTPEPTAAPPTPTPWIIVVTATPGSEEVAGAAPTQTPWIQIVTATLGPPKPAESQPTQTPWIIVATPTTGGPTRAAATAAATTRPRLTPTPLPASPEPTRTLAAAGPSPTSSPGATRTEIATSPSATASLPVPSATPGQPEAMPSPTATYEAPGLREPQNGQRVAWKGVVVLEWAGVGDLAWDEYYRVELVRPALGSVPEYSDSFYVKDTQFEWGGAAKDPFHPPDVQGDAEVTWQVRVVRQIGEDADGKPIGVELSPPSEKRSLLLEPKPGDA